MAKKFTFTHDMFDVTDKNIKGKLQPHIDEVIKAILYLDLEHVKMTTHVERQSDKNISIHIAMKDSK